MKHFDYVEWVLYKDKLINDELYEEMEDHLYLCDQCLNIFLSLIDHEEIQEAEKLISTDFTQGIMAKVKNIRPMKKRTKRSLPKDFFIYYTAVASVAIILTAGGFFGKLVDSVPEIEKSIRSKEEQILGNAIYNFSEEITKKTSIFIKDFEISKNKED